MVNIVPYSPNSNAYPKTKFLKRPGRMGDRLERRAGLDSTELALEFLRIHQYALIALSSRHESAFNLPLYWTVGPLYAASLPR